GQVPGRDEERHRVEGVLALHADAPDVPGPPRVIVGHEAVVGAGDLDVADLRISGAEVRGRSGVAEVGWVVSADIVASCIVGGDSADRGRGPQRHSRRSLAPAQRSRTNSPPPSLPAQRPAARPEGGAAWPALYPPRAAESVTGRRARIVSGAWAVLS